MKNLFKFFLIPCLLVFTFSCTKTDVLESESDVVEASAEDLENAKEVLSATLNENEAKTIVENAASLGYLSFADINEYNAFVNYISDYDEEMSLLNGVSYETFEDNINLIYDEIGALEDDQEEEFLQIIDRNSDFFEIITLEDGDAELVEKEYVRSSIRSFLNTNRVIKIGDNFRKYVGDMVVESTNLEDLINLNTTEQITNSGLFSFEITKKISSSNSASTRAENDRGTTLTWSTTKDQAWCHNDRRITYSLWFETGRLDLPNGAGRVYNIIPAAKVTAYRKRGCIWAKYTTNIVWFYHRTQHTIDGIDFNWFENNEISRNAKEIKRNGMDGGFNLLTFDNSVSACWRAVQSSATHRGMGAGRTVTVNERFSGCN